LKVFALRIENTEYTTVRIYYRRYITLVDR
jgi:hypothetical protein